MTIKECIDIVDNIKPNQYTVKDKVMWLSFIDEIIINEVLKTHEGYDGRYDDFEGYSEEKLSAPLIVSSPYDRLYTAYLKMKIDSENGETARYNNSAALYNTYMMEYRKHYNKTHMPLSSKDRFKQMPPKKSFVGLSEAEYEKLKRDLYFLLSDDVNKVVSPDKLYEIVTSYVSNNAEMLKGKDGYAPEKGVDYFTDSEIKEIVNAVVEDLKYLCPNKVSDLENDSGYITEKELPIRAGQGNSSVVFGGNTNKAKGASSLSGGYTASRIPNISIVETDVYPNIKPTDAGIEEDVKKFFTESAQQFPLYTDKWYIINYNDKFYIVSGSIDNIIISDDIYPNETNGLASVSIGSGNCANGDASANFGSLNTTGLKESDAENYPNDVQWGGASSNFGYDNYTPGAHATSLGSNNVNKGYKGIAGGHGNKIFSFASVGLGYGNEVGNPDDIYYGHKDGANTDGAGSVGIGWKNIARHLRAILLGSNLKSAKADQVVVGKWNAEDPDADFILGNGSRAESKRNVALIKPQGHSYTSIKDNNFCVHPGHTPVITFSANTLSKNINVGDTITFTYENHNYVSFVAAAWLNGSFTSWGYKNLDAIKLSRPMYYSTGEVVDDGLVDDIFGIDRSETAVVYKSKKTQGDISYIISAKELTLNGYVNISMAPANDTDAVNKYYVDSNLPTKVSELENDTDFAEKSDIPTRVSQLENDAGYIENNGKIHENVSAVSGGYIQFNTHMQASNTSSSIKISSSGVNISSQHGGVHISDVSTPTEDTDAANKAYVDGLVGDIETALDGIIAYQNSLIGGETE